MATLGLTGDVMLGRLVDRRQRERDRPTAAVWGDLRERLRDLDGLCVNLESPLSTRGEPWTETDRPFHFRAAPDWAVPALRAAGVDLATLANNHALDFGAVALVDTLDALDDAGIAAVGAGRTRAAARDPALVEVGGYDVAVVAFTDNTPEYAASEDDAGVSYVRMDPDRRATRETVGAVLDAARALDPDLVVATLHWGPNMTAEPADVYRAFGRWLIEQGVDLVHGHSAHVFQGIEVHEGAPILYDAGDFVDDYRVDRELRNDRSFLFVADFDATGVDHLRLEPVEIRTFAVHRAAGDAAAWCRRTMRERSRPFGTTFERDGEALVCPVR